MIDGSSPNHSDAVSQSAVEPIGPSTAVVVWPTARYYVALSTICSLDVLVSCVFSLILRHWRALLLKILHKPVIKEACLWKKNIPDILHVAIRSTIAEKRPLFRSLPFPKLSLILASEIDHFDRKFDVVVRVCHRDGRCCRGSRPFIVTETVYSGYTRLTVHALRRKCRKPTKWNFWAGFQQSSRPVTLSVVFRFIHWGSQSQ